MPITNDTCVVHLVRASNGTAPFARFLNAYASCPGGAPHDLALILKGFPSRDAAAEHLAMAAGRVARTLFVPDRGFDILPYFRAADAFAYDHFCFLNSYSVPLDPAWLAKMLTPARRPGVGLVGATASSASYLTEPLHGMASELTRFWNRPGAVAALRAARNAAVAVADLAAALPWAKPFPAHHVRTNAFLISRRLMRALRRPRRLATKGHALAFESGRDGLTAQVLRRGLQAVVVGRDGRAYGPDEWSASRTFWSGDQENLLVADNQTMAYQSETAARRAYLRWHAWREGDRPAARQGYG